MAKLFGFAIAERLVSDGRHIFKSRALHSRIFIGAGLRFLVTATSFLNASSSYDCYHLIFQPAFGLREPAD
jgi:hypothetical protein